MNHHWWKIDVVYEVYDMQSMQLFDGSHKQRRLINLGGSNARSATRDAALNKAQADRKAREQERQRQKAALLIQKFWRGRKEALQVASTFREEEGFWDWDYRIRRLALSFNLKFDFEKLLSAVRHINSSTPDEHLRLSTRNPFSFKKFLSLVLQVIGSRQFITTKSSIHQASVFDEENEQLLRTLFTSINVIPESYIDRVYESLGKFTLAFLNSSADVKLLVKTFKSLQLAVITPLKEKPNCSLNCMLFTYFKVGVNTPLWTQLVGEVASAIPLDSLQFFRVRLQDEELLCKDACNVLVNFMTLYPIEKSDWLVVVARLIRQITLVHTSKEEEEEEDEAGPKHDPFEGTALHDALLHLASGSNFEFVLVQASSSVPAYFATFIISLLQLLPCRRSNILMQIAVMASDTHIVRSFWKVVKGTSIYHSVLHDLKAEFGAGGWVEVVFLMEMYSRILMTMADDEFLDCGRNPLTLDEVKEITDFLKPLSFIFWAEKGLSKSRLLGGSTITFAQARTLITQLIQQIHARDSRRQFLPPGHWLLDGHILCGFIDAVVQEYRKTCLEEQDEVPGDYEEVTPRLNILRNIPFLIPFDTRVEILQTFISLDKERLNISAFQFDARQAATVRRNYLFRDAFDQLNSLGAGLKSRLSIEFIDQHGLKEMGIDGGGLTKEFITSICKQVFHTDYGLFVETKDNLLYPNPSSISTEPQNLAYYEFLGRVVGKAIYEGILVDAALAPFFLLKWLGRLSYLDDLSSLDDSLYHGLMQLKHYTGDVEADFALNFTITDEEFGKSRTIELIPNGSNVSVTNGNRLQYIHLVSNYRLNTQLSRQSAAFVRGLSDLIETSWLAMFNQQELQTLVGGAPGAIDLVDLRKHTKYYDFADTDQFIGWFWSILAELPQSDVRRFLKFVTSVERPPLLGFKELNPPFSIRYGGNDYQRLPSASTCINLLKVPRYKTKSDLKKKIMMAIQHGEGFGLS